METWGEGVHLYVSKMCRVGQGTYIVKEDIDDVINNVPCYDLVQVVG
jgi:hypothetical protein